MKTILLFSLLSLSLCAQTTINGSRTILGTWDASGAASTKPAKSGTSLPGTCSVGEEFFKTDATAGQNKYYCTATNTWTQQLNSGGAVTAIDRPYATIPHYAALTAAAAPGSSGIRGSLVYIPTPVTINHIGTILSTSVASSTARLGVYDTSCNLILQSGELALSGTANTALTTTLGSPVTVPAGAYYFVWAATTTSNSMGGASISSVIQSLFNAGAAGTHQMANASVAATIPGSGLPSSCGTWSAASGSTSSLIQVIIAP